MTRGWQMLVAHIINTKITDRKTSTTAWELTADVKRRAMSA